jgi:hypothetical protein
VEERGSKPRAVARALLVSAAMFSIAILAAAAAWSAQSAANTTSTTHAAEGHVWLPWSIIGVVLVVTLLVVGLALTGPDR